MALTNSLSLLMLAASAGVGRADENPALARELLADASLRASLAEGPTGESGKDDKGFFIKTGATRLNLGARLEYRFIANQREDDALDDELTTGFGFRRIRVTAKGSLTDELGYSIQGNFGNGTSLGLTDAYMSWKFDDKTVLRAGQLKVPLLKEEIISHTRQLAAERSIVNSVFTQDYSQGVDLVITQDATRLGLALSDGLRTLNTDFDAGTEADFAATARAEYKFSGDWKNFDAFTSFPTGKEASYVGAALHYQSGGSTGGTNDRDLLEYTIDASIKGPGWNAYAAFVGRREEVAAGDFNDAGFLVQGGYFLSDQWEAFARYAHVMPDSDRVNGGDFREVTLGANYYFFPESTAVRFTGDVNYDLDDTIGSSSIVRTSAANGLLPSAEDGQVSLRLQLLVSF
jgi:hypothetical protein